MIPKIIVDFSDNKNFIQSAPNNYVSLQSGDIFSHGKITKENTEDVNSLKFCDIRHNIKDNQNLLFSNGEESIIVEPVPDDDNIVHGRDIGIWVMSSSFTKFFFY